jgi:hypothetical protein
MIDDGEADDKIISVLENDYAWGSARSQSCAAGDGRAASALVLDLQAGAWHQAPRADRFGLWAEARSQCGEGGDRGLRRSRSQDVIA